MSLRPAQELVQESSKFSLRQFFESQASQAIRSPAALPIERFPTLNPSTDSVSAPMLPLAPQQQQNSPPSSLVAPQMRPHTPVEGRVPVGAPPPKDGKFTFTGLMPTTTPIQMQHKILQQHQQQANSQPMATSTKPIGLLSDSGNDVMRLKAQIVSLNERLAQTTANLASTSESVIRGNKALTTERAQFHAKYASLTRKLEATQAALAEAEAVPREDFKHNAKLLNAKVLELQEENEKLVATRAQLEASLAEAEATVASTARALGDGVGVDGDVDVENDKSNIDSELSDLKGKFTSLSLQHSSLLDKHAQMEQELEEKNTLLEAAEAEVGEANERAETWELEATELQQKVEASQLEIAQTDSLIDTLDEKLAAARMDATTGTLAEDVIKAQVETYFMENINLFKKEEDIKKGDYVIDYDSGRVGIVETDWDGVGDIEDYKPTIRYEDKPNEVNSEYTVTHFAVFEERAKMPPFPWAPGPRPLARAPPTYRPNYSHPGQPPTYRPTPEAVQDQLNQLFGASSAGEESIVACCPATMRCEEMERDAEAARAKTHGASEHEYAQLHEEWQFLDRQARRARHALTTSEPDSERVMVAHVYTSNNASEAPIDLASHIDVNPLPMGKPIDDSCLLCTTTADTDAAAERDTATSAGRTNAFVEAVSKDLKFSMDGSRALYASSSATGVALRV